MWFTLAGISREWTVDIYSFNILVENSFSGGYFNFIIQ